MRTFYSIYYKPSIYGEEPYIKDNQMFVSDNLKQAEHDLEILKFDLKMTLKPTIEKRGWFKTPIKVYNARTEQGKLTSRVLETLHIRKITIHHEKNY